MAPEANPGLALIRGLELRIEQCFTADRPTDWLACEPKRFGRSTAAAPSIGERSTTPRRSDLRPYLSGANDMGGRCALRRVRDAHRNRRVSAVAVASCVEAVRPAGAARGGTGRAGSDPPVRGPGTGSGAGVIAQPAPAPRGRSRSIDPWREGGSAPLRGGGSPVRRRCGRRYAGGGGDGTANRPSGRAASGEGGASLARGLRRNPGLLGV